MLILSRRVGESVLIGGDISITVLSVKGNHVRLGVNAPKSVAVYREELSERNRADGTVAVGERDAEAANGDQLVNLPSG